MQIPRYLLHNLIALNQLLNTLLAGHPDEGLSSRSHRLYEKSRKWAVIRRVINALFFWQDDHCAKAWLEEHLRRHLPPEFRK